MDNLFPIYCTKCQSLAAWSVTTAGGHVGIICSLCVQDEHLVLRWLKRIKNLFPGTIAIRAKHDARIQQSNNVNRNINQFAVLKHDGNYEVEQYDDIYISHE